ncbi:MAG: FlgD immunoglobulin-like domain containing protein [bacterium]
MKKTKYIILSFTLAISLLWRSSPSFSQNYTLSWYSFAQGGGVMSSSNYGQRGVMGYGSTGNSASQNYGLGSEFLQVMLWEVDIYLGDELKVYNFPNPFNSLKERTRIKYFLPGSGEEEVFLRIYTVSGEVVREIEEGKKEKGHFYFVDWDGKNGDGERVASGVYILLLKAGSRSTLFKMAVIK